MADPIEAFNRMMAEVDARRHAQNLPKAPEVKPPVLNENEGQIYFVSENREPRVDDLRGMQSLPGIVAEDNKGWKDVGWEW